MKFTKRQPVSVGEMIAEEFRVLWQESRGRPRLMSAARSMTGSL